MEIRVYPFVAVDQPVSLSNGFFCFMFFFQVMCEGVNLCFLYLDIIK